MNDFADANGDGIPDILRRGSLYFRDRDGVVRTSRHYLHGHERSVGESRGPELVFPTRLWDMDGDGDLDLVGRDLIHYRDAAPGPDAGAPGRPRSQ